MAPATAAVQYAGAGTIIFCVDLTWQVCFRCALSMGTGLGKAEAGIGMPSLDFSWVYA